jgi:hypothetical protein
MSTSLGVVGLRRASDKGTSVSSGLTHTSRNLIIWDGSEESRSRESRDAGEKEGEQTDEVIPTELSNA